MTDLYEILGLTKDADAKSIKQAYRELAKRNHPDTGGDENEFKRIVNAYEILSDETKRARYDAGEPIEAEDRTTRAKRNISKILNSVLTGGYFAASSSDLIRIIRAEINQVRLKMESDVEDLEIELRTLQDTANRVKNCEFIVKSIETTIAFKETEIETIREEIEVSHVMDDVIKDAEYETDKEEEENDELSEWAKEAIR